MSEQRLLELKIQYGAMVVRNRIKLIEESKLYLIKDELDVKIFVIAQLGGG